MSDCGYSHKSILFYHEKWGKTSDTNNIHHHG
jgi:hypothetical protein